MKRIILTFLMIFGIYAFASAEKSANKILVVYYSKTTHTKTVAEEIEKQTGADIFALETVDAYDEPYKEAVQRAKKEQEENKRPGLLNHIENLDEYDYIFIGYPLWCGNKPMFMYTFFDEYDFSGKKIIPFVTYGGSLIARGWEDIPELEPDALIVEKFAVRAGDLQKCPKTVKKVLENLSLN